MGRVIPMIESLYGIPSRIFDNCHLRRRRHPLLLCQVQVRLFGLSTLVRRRVILNVRGTVSVHRRRVNVFVPQDSREHHAKLVLLDYSDPHAKLVPAIAINAMKGLQEQENV
jgi:hypothetical protein